MKRYLFGLLAKKCEYCHNRITTENLVKANVKVPGYVGTHRKHFCSEEHLGNYNKEIDKKSGNCASGCC